MYVGGYLFLYYFWELIHIVSKVEKLHTEYLLTKRMGYYFYRVHFLRCLFWFALFYFLSMSSYSLLVRFCLLFGFLFFCLYEHFFATIHSYHVHFPHCWVCIVLLFVVVFFFFT
jgi:hypothetical protein